MPMVYSVVDTGHLISGADTEDDLVSVAVGTRNVALRAVTVASGGNTDNAPGMIGIAIRVVKFATASTGGGSITPSPRDPGMQAATHSAHGVPTPGSTRTNYMVFGCGNDIGGGWVAPSWYNVLLSEGGSGESIDVLATMSFVIAVGGNSNAPSMDVSLETVE